MSAKMVAGTMEALMSKRALICGFHPINARLARNPESIKELYLAKNKDDKRSRDLEALAASRGVRVMRAPIERIDGMAPNQRHNGVVAFVEAISDERTIDEIVEDARDAGDTPIIVILDNVTDPHNLGAIMRTADAMGAHAIVVPKNNSAGMSATVSKVSAGASESLPFFQVSNLAREMRKLKDLGLWIAGTGMDAQSTLPDFEIPKQGIVWVLGNEGSGMRRLTEELCDYVVSIPMYGTVESMNVSVSAGMVLYETRRQLSKAKD